MTWSFFRRVLMLVSLVGILAMLAIPKFAYTKVSYSGDYSITQYPFIYIHRPVWVNGLANIDVYHNKTNDRLTVSPLDSCQLRFGVILAKQPNQSDYLVLGGASQNKGTSCYSGSVVHLTQYDFEEIARG